MTTSEGAVCEFWFDYSCPYAYLASTQIDALARRTGARLSYRPMLLGGVFKANATPQNLSEVLSPAKKRHNELDLARWAAHRGVALNKPAGHPLRTVEALRATLATGVDPQVVHGFFRAYWVEGRDPSARETIAEVVGRAGHEPEQVLARLDEAAIKDDLRARTDEAIALGIFGAPSFVVRRGGETRLFWGQDRMDLVERALGGERDERALGGALVPEPPEERGRARDSRKVLEVFWDFSSPYSYLGCTQAEALAERTGARLEMRPMLLGALFKAIGTADAPLLASSPAKQRYFFDDLRDWAGRWGVPFAWPSRFPMNTVKALRCYLALPEERRRAFRDATYRAYWAEDRDISSDAELKALLGADADEILARTQTGDIKEALFAATQRAVDAGVFGAPTWIVRGEDQHPRDGELFWGQDRIELVEAALRR